MSEETRSFEDVMQELETIVQKLEADDVPLEKAISYYQRGIELSKWCDDKLSTVEQQVADIVGEDGTVETVKLEEENDGNKA
ncbi:Exodeoxyribonuclease VII small subunit [Pelagirhabdus alkalitolerans]|uniref:Exodeoxyribonuclease 7 small subunit n=1 Tax=Pelagirhabdus alkalitolerans TaxID=1612202 RepID=A0A1G6I1R7_9BACI|nr:exodeoxyribonuclease VII small subunit [Pelagirhabdus alkalitolerans]SDC00482.1 Exodeoxyribonuclease VII small subunit [Pelagirhabdus alkalitolerans]